MNDIIYTDFLDDEEKMRDFTVLTKEEFLLSYSYLTEEEYDLTVARYNARKNRHTQLLRRSAGGNDLLSPGDTL